MDLSRQIIRCVYWESAGVSGGGGCKIHAHGAYLVSFSKCKICQYRSEDGMTKLYRKVSLVQAEVVSARKESIRPICEGCKDFNGFAAMTDSVFEDLIKCNKCRCSLKKFYLMRPCPAGKFE